MNKGSKVMKEAVNYLLLVVGAAVLALILNRTVVVNAQVPSASMESTIMTGDRILVSRLSYRFAEPERGDIIMFRYPDNEEEEWLKRIIGLPGEKLEIRDGSVYINESEEPLVESYLPEKAEGDFGPYEIPEGCYFVMGDNRNVSFDSREWTTTCVSREQIIGKAVLVYYPRLGVPAK